MKKTFVIIGIVALAFFSLLFSCNVSSRQEDLVVGNWQLVMTKDNNSITNYNLLQSHTIQFLSDNTYIHTSNDNTAYESGTWILINKDKKLILRKVLQNYEIKFTTHVSKANFVKEGDKNFVYHYRNDKLESKDETNPGSELEVINVTKDVLEIGEKNSTIYKYTRTQGK